MLCTITLVDIYDLKKWKLVVQYKVQIHKCLLVLPCWIRLNHEVNDTLAWEQCMFSPYSLMIFSQYAYALLTNLHIYCLQSVALNKITESRPKFFNITTIRIKTALQQILNLKKSYISAISWLYIFIYLTWIIVWSSPSSFLDATNCSSAATERAFSSFTCWIKFAIFFSYLWVLSASAFWTVSCSTCYKEWQRKISFTL